MDPFAVLGLPPTATPAQVKAAYRAKSRELHPDAGGDEAAFRELVEAAHLAAEYADGTRPNPYLQLGERGHRVVMDTRYDRHRYSPMPPPNPWRTSRWGGALFWILPVLAGIFMLSGATGPLFLPVFIGSVGVFGLVVWLVLRHRR